MPTDTRDLEFRTTQKKNHGISNFTTSYADDFTILESGVDLDEIDGRLNQDLRRIEEWATQRVLTISAGKCSVTFFSTDSHHPQVFFGDPLVLVPLVKKPNIIGVTLDPQLTFCPHAKLVVSKALRSVPNAMSPTTQ